MSVNIPRTTPEILAWQEKRQKIKRKNDLKGNFLLQGYVYSTQTSFTRRCGKMIKLGRDDSSCDSRRRRWNCYRGKRKRKLLRGSIKMSFAKLYMQEINDTGRRVWRKTIFIFLHPSIRPSLHIYLYSRRIYTSVQIIYLVSHFKI